MIDIDFRKKIHSRQKFYHKLVIFKRLFKYTKLFCLKISKNVTKTKKKVIYSSNFFQRGTCFPSFGIGCV